MRFDAIVIGSGQAGVPLSFRFADAGWSVALIERGVLGGTCINTGCSPTKTMVHRAQVAHYARNAERWGVQVTDVRADLPAIVAQKNQLVQRVRGGKQKQLESRKNLHFYHGEARFVGPHQLQVGSELLESEKVFINAGGRPHIPEIAGLHSIPFFTNENIMDLTELPEHLIVLGGGYIGLEFAQMFVRFGSRVTLIHNANQLVPREDPEIAAELQKALEAEGIRVLLSAEVSSIEKHGNSIVANSDGPSISSQVAGTHLLIATGRKPNTEALDLQAAGVQTDAHGFVRVNDRLETSVFGVWALGDVKGGPAFTHISYNDYQIVAANLLEGASRSTAGRIVPYCVFTDPQLGGVGMTEKEARARGFKLKIGTLPMTSVARALERDETAGLMKIIIDASNDRVLGATILATEGGELVHVLYTLMLADLPYTLLKGAVYIHPTLTEGFFSLLENVKPVA